MHDPLVVVRVDASSTIGRGHLERTFALVDGLVSRGWRAHIVTTTGDDVLHRAEALGWACNVCNAPRGSAPDLACLRGVVAGHEAQLVIVDGYPLRGEYLRSLREGSRAVVACIDDAHDGLDTYACDVLVNANLYAERERPHLPPAGEALLGPAYALLRREITDARDRVSPLRREGRVLVTLGGSDQSSVLATVSDGLRDLGDVRILLGGSRPDAVVGAAVGWQVCASSSSMAEELLTSDVIVAGAGTTVLEMCCIGVPAVVIAVAENQRRVAREAAERGVAMDLGDSSSLTASAVRSAVRRMLDDRTARDAMISRQRTIVDGQGALRVAARLDARARAQAAHEGMRT